MKAGAIGGAGAAAVAVGAAAAPPPEPAEAPPCVDAGGHPGFHEANAGDEEAPPAAFMVRGKEEN